MYAMLALINILLDLLWFLMLFSVILSWLIAFNILNTYQPVVNTLTQIVGNLTEPILRPIRGALSNIIPASVPVDLSPLVALILIRVLQVFINQDVAPLLLS